MNYLSIRALTSYMRLFELSRLYTINWPQCYSSYRNDALRLLILCLLLLPLLTVTTNSTSELGVLHLISMCCKKLQLYYPLVINALLGDYYV